MSWPEAFTMVGMGAAVCVLFYLSVRKDNPRRSQ